MFRRKTSSSKDSFFRGLSESLRSDNASIATHIHDTGRSHTYRDRQVKFMKTCFHSTTLHNSYILNISIEYTQYIAMHSSTVENTVRLTKIFSID